MSGLAPIPLFTLQGSLKAIDIYSLGGVCKLLYHEIREEICIGQLIDKSIR